MSASKLIPIGCSANPPLSNFNKADSSAKTLQACLAYGKDPKKWKFMSYAIGKKLYKCII